MWGIEITASHLNSVAEMTRLPPIDLQTVLLILVILLVGRICLYKLMSHVFRINDLRQQTKLDTLQFSYLYHLSIIILVLSDVNWNGFDLCLWILSYVAIGKIRHSIHQIRMERELMLNDYSYNNKIVMLLLSSKVYGLVLFFLSLGYFMCVHTAFMGISMKMTSLLLFPTLMLTTDSLFLWLGSNATKQDILCYFNPNINEVPSSHKLNIIHNIIGSSIRSWHYYNLFRIFFKTFIQKIQFLDCMWILSVINAGYLSMSTLLRSFQAYRTYNKLINRMNQIFKKNPSTPNQNCIICMDQLLNCRRLVPCGHLFHYKCLFQWVQTKSQCPICREPINLNL